MEQSCGVSLSWSSSIYQDLLNAVDELCNVVVMINFTNHKEIEYS